MTASTAFVRALLRRFQDLRNQAGISVSQLEEALILGPGWVSRFESGETIPRMDVLLVMLNQIGFSFWDLFQGIDIAEPPEIERQVFAEPQGNNLVLHFLYANYNAKYILRNATLEQFDSVLSELRNSLARLISIENNSEIEAIKTDSLVSTFLRATRIWPHANPSDLWWFLVYRAFCDPFNHPAEYARLDFSQSWKRTSGWALEKVLVRHYAPFLQGHGINILIVSGERKDRLLSQIQVADRLEAAKVDVLLSGIHDEREECFGVVHVKASFAERRTDDVPMSRALIEAGYTSPLWTMDCKSSPSASPQNNGELGVTLVEGRDRRSAKRKDIEDDGYFSACFSYNKNTKPTPDDQQARAKIIVCDFTNPDDRFSRFIISEWARFRAMGERAG